MSTVRQRHVRTPSPSPSPPPPPAELLTERVAAEDRGRISALDVLRVLAGLVLLSSALSYLVTNTSLTWNHRPAWTRPAVVRAWLVRWTFFFSPSLLCLSLWLPYLVAMSRCSLDDNGADTTVRLK